MGRPNAELMLTCDEQAQLQSLARSHSLPAALTVRAKLLLACAAGAPNSEVAQRLGVTNATVGKWRRRFVEPPTRQDADRPRLMRAYRLGDT